MRGRVTGLERGGAQRRVESCWKEGIRCGAGVQASEVRCYTTDSHNDAKYDFKPLNINYKSKDNVLIIQFDDGKEFTYSAEYLRVYSPSAEMLGYNGKRRIIGGKLYVRIKALEPVGTYALRISFDDLHETGIYTWSYLYELGERQLENMETYTKQLEERKLTRFPTKS